jgi:aspartyl-tRNA(Asn)/glutamyl-tRNA(Gln) amidotransferase subunit C
MATEHTPKSEFAINADMVKHVAYLVRLGILEEEAQAFSHQFTSIIDYFRLLNEVDTSAVPPACETSNTTSIMRSDEETPSLPRQGFLKNAPHRDGNYIQVPQVFGEE